MTKWFEHNYFLFAYTIQVERNDEFIEVDNMAELVVTNCHTIINKATSIEQPVALIGLTRV